MLLAATADDLDRLCAAAAGVRDAGLRAAGREGVVTYSPKVLSVPNWSDPTRMVVTMERPKPVRVAVCPACGSREANAIWCGMPAGDPELSCPPEVSLGGRLVNDANPDRLCNTCGHEWLTHTNARGLRGRAALEVSHVAGQ